MKDLSLGSVFTVDGTEYKVTYVSGKRVVLSVIAPPKEVKATTKKRNDKRLRKSVCGVGYIGIGNHISRDADGIQTKKYRAWYNIINLSYGTYATGDTTVCKEWHSFQAFGDWYDVHGVDLEGWCITTTAIDVTNKNYSPEDCLFVPRSIAMSRIQSAKKSSAKASRVRYLVREAKYVSELMLDGKMVRVGKYATEELAVEAVLRATREYHLLTLLKNQHLMSKKNYDIARSWYVTV